MPRLAIVQTGSIEPLEDARGAPDPGRVEFFAVAADSATIVRSIHLRNGRTISSKRSAVDSIPQTGASDDAVAAAWDASYLRLAAPSRADGKDSVRTVDLFSGCGAMTLGLSEAARAVGTRLQPLLALDSSPAALAVYSANFPTARAVLAPIETLLDRELGARPSASERNFVGSLRSVDVLVGGPPCQGHSNLNNHTRRSDPKNRLYDRMARFAELARPTHVMIENVSAVLHDTGHVVERTLDHLLRLGYNVDQGVVEVSTLGVPQHRRRHVLVASLALCPSLKRIMASLARPARSVRWAIGDLSRMRDDRPFHTAGVPSHLSRRRIDYLFDHGLYELPDEQRPDCHRLKKHSYKSVYGRLRWEHPSQTITSGFSSMGQGRYVHPSQRRTLTPHEAARLQFIPDYFDFSGESSRTALAEMIGNAVPPKLSYALGLELLR